IQRRWLGVDQVRITAWMRGQLTSEQFITVLAEELDQEFGDMYAGFVQSCVEMRLDVPEVCDSVRRIRGKGAKVYIATDNMDSISRWTGPSLGLERVFDGVLSSHQVGCLKQDLSVLG